MNIFRIGFIPLEKFDNLDFSKIQWLEVFSDSLDQAYDDFKSLREKFKENVYFIKSLISKRIYSYEEFLLAYGFK